MRAPVLVLGFIFAWAAALAGCGDNDSGGGTDRPGSGDKDITAFSLLSAKNPGLASDVNATINADSITATVPFGTDVTALVATFDTNGASVTVGGAAQVSGTTANDFSRMLTYTVTAEDGSTRNYTANVTTAASNANAITAFSFTMANNATLGADVTATINDHAIAATVPNGTDVSALVATYTATGTSVKVGGAAQTSGTTPNSFTSPVDYVVTAADGSSATYTVAVTVAASSAKDLTMFSFKSADNGANLTADVTAVINGANITATVPFGTNVTALVAAFSTTGASVKVGATDQVSGTTPNDFTSPVTYTVAGADGTTKAYTVAITVAQNPAKAITAYAFKSTDNPGLGADVVATIDEAAHTIAATAPSGTDVTALVATFSTTGVGVKIGNTDQVSGTTANNFSAPLTYTVRAGDNSTQDYVVTVTVAQGNSRMISAFSFDSASNPGLSANVTATIDEGNKTIDATVPFGTNITALVATFATSGASVKVGGANQTSGMTPNNFTTPVSYVVTASDGTTATYVATVTVALNSAKAITDYKFTVTDNPTLTGAAVVTITGSDIAAVLPFGTSTDTLKTLIAEFTTTGNTIKVGTTAQISGATANDFTAPIAYVVTAQDGTSATYTVTVTIAKSPAKAITKFSFLLTKNPGIFVTTAPGVIDETAHTVTIELPPGLNLTALIATFTTTGSKVEVGATTQVTDVTTNNFTSPVTYKVTAADNTTQNYLVTIKPFVTSFSFTNAAGNEATFLSDGTNPGLSNQPTMSRMGGTASGSVGTFSGAGWTTDTAPDLAHYYAFSVKPKTAMTLTQLTLKDQHSSTGPTAFSVRSSLDAFATDIGGVLPSHTSISAAATVITLPAAFANATVNVEFRLYSFGSVSTSGTWRIDDVQLSGTAQ